MSTITGPKIQMPTSLSTMFETDDKGNIIGLKQEWAQFFHAMQGTVYAGSRSGPSTSRPDFTSTQALDFRYIGMPYFDTHLGKPIYLKTASSNVWVDATGAVV